MLRKIRSRLVYYWLRMMSLHGHYTSLPSRTPCCSTRPCGFLCVTVTGLHVDIGALYVTASIIHVFPFVRLFWQPHNSVSTFHISSVNPDWVCALRVCVACVCVARVHRACMCARESMLIFFHPSALVPVGLRHSDADGNVGIVDLLRMLWCTVIFRQPW